MGNTCSWINNNTIEYRKIKRINTDYYNDGFYDGFYDLQPHDIVECSIIENEE